MKLKAGVKFGNPIIAICVAMQVVNSIYTKYGFDCVITSFNDGQHMVKSKHYSDSAFDCRTKNISFPAIKQQMIAEIKLSLGENYDVIFESEGTDNEHLHFELKK